MWTLLVWVVLIFTILTHEMGHFMTMREHNIGVEKFSIGFGPGILKYESDSGTTFQIAPILLGGFVRPEKSIKDISKDMPYKIGADISAAGPLVNLIFGSTFAALWVIASPTEALTSPILWGALIGLFLLIKFRKTFSRYIALPIGLITGMVLLYFLFTATRETQYVIEMIWEVDSVTDLLKSGAVMSIFVALFNLAPFVPLDGSWITISALRKFERVQAAYLKVGFRISIFLLIWVMIT